MGRQVRFDPFRFDPETGRLWAGEQELRLTPKSAAVLTLLVAHAGETVTKENLFSSVWPDTAVSDDALTTCVAELRRALEDDAKQPRFIETRHRRGYRFAAPLSPVEEVAAPTLDQSASAVATVPAPALAATPGQRRAKWILGAAAGALVVLLIAVVPAFRRSASSRVPIRSLAVLPLANLTGDPAQEYFSDGMTDVLITNLASLSALRVISRQSVMRYKGSAKPLPEIARELGVEGVVQGSVVRSGGRVRVTAQLVHAPTDRHLWARTYERRMEDVLALQGELSRAIAEEVRLTVGAKERQRLTPERTVKPEAYDAYLLGRHHWNLRTEQSLDKALSYFQAAIAADPDFALAHAGLAITYAPRLVIGYVPPGRGLAEQKTAALRALELDPGLGEARAALGSVRTQEWDWQAAETEFRTAIEDDPGSTLGHLWYGWYLHALGRFDEALVQRRRAMELDPLNVTVNRALAVDLGATGQDEAALAQWNRALELEPDHARTELELAQSHFELGLVEEGSMYLDRARSHAADNPQTLAHLAVVCAMSGNADEARQWLGRLKTQSASRYVSKVLPAYVHLALDERDKAFALLEEAYRVRDPLLIPIPGGTVGPLDLPKERAAALRSDARFADLLRRMGLVSRAPDHPK
jgi:TolB-like protein/DNA-binding winged helix-turn-helix (wHTH) protein/Tfp pilus assembly protein PilF